MTVRADDDSNGDRHLRPGVYEHYKGAHYLVIGVARDDSLANDERLLVVYSRLYRREGVPLCARPLEEFLSLVDTPHGRRERFRYVGFGDTDGREIPVTKAAN